VAWFFQGIGGIIGCIIAAVMMDTYHPKYAFLFYSIVGLIVAICCFFLRREAENEFIDGEEDIETEFSS
jgi:sugar phosphate permease